ncbi:MAG: glycoside hydrolase family 2 protein [Planctomycetes bacterium]|nr:glycoside hydrolase family 2 protein [Planctomycetota bacterium]
MQRNNAPKCRERLLLDFDWKFYRGDVQVDRAQGHGATYSMAKAGAAEEPAKLDYPDETWQAVNLPHDWVVGGTFDKADNLSHGFLPRGIGWYRRAFRLDPEDRARHLSLEFDGVGTFCTVCLNGQTLHRNWCGYTSFKVDITDVASFGDDINVLAVKIDANAFEGWWYEGAGIYRHTWLVKTDPIHVAHWGTFVNPTKSADGRWTANIETTIDNDSCADEHCTLESRIVNADGECVATMQSPCRLAARSSVVVAQSVQVDDPKLWSLEAPNLYTMISTISAGGRVADEYETTFGFRTLEFDADNGFFLNGRPVKMKGTCNHQDHAGVGVAVPDRVQEFRIRRLKEMGCNAYRCAHNPTAPELLDACDRLGMLVMDENRRFDSSREGIAQLEGLVRRDRNHPSVVMWSIFNEEPLQSTETGRRMAERMTACIKKLDASRPVTAAMNAGVFDEGVSRAVDVMGINYSQDSYDQFHKLNPQLPIVGSETASAVTTRGIYTSDETKGYCDAYDRMAPPWGTIAGKAWEHVATRPFVMGTFVWTGFDYRGEPTPYQWPCINSHFGIIDTCGFPKDSFYLYQAMWTDEPMVHILPHWNWPGREGETIKVCCYTNCDSAELFLNGASLGEQEIDPFEQAEWDVAYAHGALRAEAKRGGEVVAVKTVETTGRPATIRLTPGSATINADCEDVALVEVCALDAEGRVVPVADNEIRFDVAGPGCIIGVGNGDPSCHESDKAHRRSLFNGYCLVIIQATDQAGEIVLTAETDGLEAATLRIESREAARRPYVSAAARLHMITGWRMSPVTAEEPDANAEIADSDMNTWQPVHVGDGPQGAFDGNRGYAVFRAIGRVPAFDPEASVPVLTFEGILGSAGVFVNGVERARKDDGSEGPVAAQLPDCKPGDELTLSVVVRNTAEQAGITGNVLLSVVRRTPRENHDLQ